MPTRTKNREGTGVVIALRLLLIVPLSAYEGWVLSVLWRWFVTPTLHVDPIGVWNAAGLALVATILTMHYSAADNLASEEMGPIDFVSHQLASIVVALTFVLPLGALYHWWA